MNRERSDYAAYSKKVTRGQRWKALRLQALERDDWRCVKCGALHRVECDHIEPVRDRPDLAFTLSNLQILCGPCHSRKTRIECGHTQLSKPRREWRNLLSSMKGKTNAGIKTT